MRHSAAAPRAAAAPTTSCRRSGGARRAGSSLACRCRTRLPGRGSQTHKGPSRARGAGANVRTLRPPNRMDHPRVRGEQSSAGRTGWSPAGSPPRARGADGTDGHGVHPHGITPACAGSRLYVILRRPHRQDHPRVRGEQGDRWVPGSSAPGSPPRARGADCPRLRLTSRHGITPACAGSSVRDIRTQDPCRDHPRVRGEQIGYPPVDRRGRGITPACAGSRGCGPCSAQPSGDHPRVRGEQFSWSAVNVTVGGSPPRARGAGDLPGVVQRRRGITPACAGSRPRCRSGGTAARDHPRVRGEQDKFRLVAHRVVGSPPRARGADMGVP